MSCYLHRHSRIAARPHALRDEWVVHWYSVPEWLVLKSGALPWCFLYLVYEMHLTLVGSRYSSSSGAGWQSALDPYLMYEFHIALLSSLPGALLLGMRHIQ